MECADTRRYLDGHLDAEVDTVTSAAIDEHLAGCSACRAQAQRLQAVRSAVRQAAPYYTPSAEFVASLRKLASQRSATPAGHKRTWPGFLRPAALVAATAAVTWLVASQLIDGPTGYDTTEQVIAAHARATLTTHVADVASSERHTVKPWLSSKLDFSPPVADLTQVGFGLSGGRLDYVNRRSVAVLVYKRRQHVIDLFVWPSDASASPPRQVTSRVGYQVLHWSGGGMTYWAVSDLNSAEMNTFADAFWKQTQ